MLSAATSASKFSGVGIEGFRPPGEGVVLVAQGGELAVFDDVGPVIDDPVAPCLLGGVGGPEAVDDGSGIGWSESEEFVDEVGLVGRCVGEVRLEFVEAVLDGGGVEFRRVGSVRRGGGRGARGEFRGRGPFARCQSVTRSGSSGWGP